MTDEAGAAPAASEPVMQPDAGNQPAPEPQAKAEPKIERSKEPARASIDRAFAEIDKQEQTAAKPKDTKPAKEQTAAPDNRERDDQGRFKPKESAGQAASAESQPEAKVSTEKSAATASEPPARFSVEAKAAWKDAPAHVQTEITRAIKELEGGLAQYQQTLEPLKRHMALAKQHGTTVHDALDGYITIEQALRSKDTGAKLTALEGIFETAGISPRDYAAHIMGQKPDQLQSQSDATIRALNQKITQLEQQIGGVTSSIQERRNDEVKSQVMKFAETHTRMNDNSFAEKVARLLETGMATDLQDAHDMAERLIPAPVVDVPTTAASTAAATPKPATDQTRKGNLSIAGAPASGSNPTARKPPASARDALDRAFAGVGIT